jgi:hypothetical protein
MYFFKSKDINPSCSPGITIGGAKKKWQCTAMLSNRTQITLAVDLSLKNETNA